MSEDKQTEAEALRRVEIAGYVAVCYEHTTSNNPTPADKNKSNSAYIYLRKQSPTKLFVANLPWPVWLPTTPAISPPDCEALQSHLSTLFPACVSVESVFPTGNGRLAARIDFAPGIVKDVLARPSHHVYLPARDRMQTSRSADATAMPSGRQPALLRRWLKEHATSRDETAVKKWSHATMATYEQREKRMAEEKAKAKSEAGKPDEDGFILVTNGAPQMKANEAVLKGPLGRLRKGKYKSKSAKNRKSLLDVNKGIEKSGFYRWQRRNEHSLSELRSKFHSDQKRAAAVRGLPHNQPPMSE